jgi:hypothetical protein
MIGGGGEATTGAGAGAGACRSVRRKAGSVADATRVVGVMEGSLTGADVGARLAGAGVAEAGIAGRASPAWTGTGSLVPSVCRKAQPSQQPRKYETSSIKLV